MTDCERLTDRMPDVAHGVAQWDEDEVRHLASCVHCAAEWRLVQAAAGLAEAESARLDPGVFSGRVLAGLKVSRVRGRWVRLAGLGGLAAAAGLVALFWPGAPAQPGPVQPIPVAAVYQLPLAELDGLDSLDLQSLLDGLDAPVGEGSTVDQPGLSGLDDDQLERVLHSLEG